MGKYLILVIIFIGLMPQSAAREKETTSVTLKLKWQHQFQFAGYYMAKELGYYDDVGLAVNIVPSLPDDTDTMREVLIGNADFGITHSGIIKKRLAGEPLVALAALLQSSPYCWLVDKDSDIHTPQDFDGQRISVLSKDENAELMTLLEHHNVDVEVVTHQNKSNVRAWIDKDIDAMQVYITNEPFVLTRRGIGYRLLCPKRYGLNVYGDVLFTSQAFLDANPDVVSRFHQASIRGWRYALLNLDEAIATTRKRYAPHKSMAQLAFEADQLKPLIMQSGNAIGAMSDARWRVITELYQIDAQKVKEHFEGFIYEPEPMSNHGTFSWMVILAICILVISIPTYLRLFFGGRT
ncbi:ABC transporter substrate-binding protein [Pseudoalteromonas sp. SSDWG2]|uniref:ABC transporter substrate-binding protein n=1 Tax=Pseudoalteromonas sp. SSDWG2 TaxID=3139391 RepID=UPI003BAC650E